MAVIVIVQSALTAACLSSGESNGLVDPRASDQPESTNRTPTIAGNPDSAVIINDLYEFEPSAQDADGDALTFAIQGMPRWASFNTSTGRLAGQPTLGDIGIYSGIRIGVSDGSSTASLPSFEVTVSQTALGNVTLTWQPPTENTDGSQLTDLAAYRIYYGRSSRNYTNQIRIDNPGITTFVIENLVQDTYYFTATAINSSGVESGFSGEAVRTVMAN